MDDSPLLAKSSKSGRMLPWMVTLPDAWLQWMLLVLYTSCIFALLEFHPREKMYSWKVLPTLSGSDEGPNPSTTLTFVSIDGSVSGHGTSTEMIKYRAFEMSHRLAEVIAAKSKSMVHNRVGFYWFEPAIAVNISISSRCDWWETGIVYEGDVIRETSPVQLRECQQICEKEEAECLFWNYHEDGESCQLLSSLDEVYRDEQYQSGTGQEDPTIWPDCTMAGTRLHFEGQIKPSDVSYLRTFSTTTCAAACAMDSRCLAWTFTHICTLSFHTPAFRKSKGAISGHRYCKDREHLLDSWPVLTKGSLKLGGLIIALLTQQNAGEKLCDAYSLQLTIPAKLADLRHAAPTWNAFPLPPTLRVMQQIQSSEAGFMQIVWRGLMIAILATVGLPALFVAGQRTGWKLRRLPLGFGPSVLQAIAAALDVDTTSIFNRALTPTRMNFWRFMVRIEMLVLLWSFYGYARMFMNSLKPSKKIAKSAIIVVFISIAYIVLVVVVYIEINQLTPLAITPSCVRCMKYFAMTWLLGLIGLWICLGSFLHLWKLLGRMAYSACWLQSQCCRFLMMVMSVSLIANVFMRIIVSMVLPLEISDLDAGAPSIPLQWVTINRWSAGMVLRETGFRTDIFGCIVNTMVAVVCLIAFLPRKRTPRSSKAGEEEGDEEEQAPSKDTFLPRRFPPHATSREIMKMRFLAHCCRIINKLDQVEYNIDEFVKEPFDSEEDIRETFSSLTVFGKPIRASAADVHVAIILGNFRGRRVGIVTFRGTKGLKNIKADLRASMTNFEDPEGDAWYTDMRGAAKSDSTSTRFIRGVRVHSGFQDSLAVVKDELLTNLRKLAEDGERIDFWLVGHSFGGALATLLSVKVNKLLSVADPERQRTSVSVFCVGSPRVGNKAFRHHFNHLGIGCVQLVMDHDPITITPPAILGYRRVGRLALLSPTGHIRTDPGFLEMSVRNNLMALGAIFMIPLASVGLANFGAAHKLAKYMTALSKGYEKECARDVEMDVSMNRLSGSRLSGRGNPRETVMPNGHQGPRSARWVLDEHTFGHGRGAEVELPESAVVCGHRALAPLFGAEAVLLRRLGD